MIVLEWKWQTLTGALLFLWASGECGGSKTLVYSQTYFYVLAWCGTQSNLGGKTVASLLLCWGEIFGLAWCGQGAAGKHWGNVVGFQFELRLLSHMRPGFMGYGQLHSKLFFYFILVLFWIIFIFYLCTFIYFMLFVV